MGKGKPGRQSLKDRLAKAPAHLRADAPEMGKSYREKRKRWILAGLRVMRAPAVVALIVSMIFADKQFKFDPSDTIQHFESFAGDMSVTLGEIKESRKAVAYDIRYDDVGMNLLTSQGFLHACYQAARLEIGSGSLAAPVCSSFVYLSRGTSMRSALRPCGDESVGFVKDGNQLLCRTLIVLMIAMSVSAWVVLEQPKGSLMERHPKFEEWARMSNIVRQHVRMGNYGAPSQKPTWLYSSLGWRSQKSEPDMPIKSGVRPSAQFGTI